ncbi:CAMK family protein kinase [Histomonas meleagridis]|uniref:CAMK family protein kinase n=1 Tax=Histomonas meleagridis TaxID=135588 RepID=UPI00355A661C|nr:CAMK family protein kinase [Histomonas meleagridis]KAH0798916.1 CAMK family protein kinase [Histomonas meleagridis]
MDNNQDTEKQHSPPEVGPYKMQGTIGEGAFSTVKLCIHQETHQYYACKIVPKKRLNTKHLRERFELEIRINQQLHHPGIVQMIDLKCDEDNYYVFMEFCPNGDLFQYIVDRKHLKESESKPIFRQILETLQYIHSIGVSHRDLKPENILIDQFGQVKISDFGLSKFVDKNNLVDTPCGSPCYASPECISGQPYNGITTDVWSCGVILYAMVTGQLPWTKRNQTQLFQQIRRGRYAIPSNLSPECQHMIKMLMTVNQEERYTVEDALNDPWLSFIPQQINPTDQKGYVSIRQVDKYFGREISNLEINESVDLCGLHSSSPNLDYNKAYNLITGSKRRNKKKKHHHRHVESEEASSGRKHRRHKHRKESNATDDAEAAQLKPKVRKRIKKRSMFKTTQILPSAIMSARSN